MHTSVRRRSLAAAASLLTLAALAVPAVPAAATEYRASAATTITDPTGDVTADDEAETPVNEARADVTAASAEYRPNEISLTVNVVRATDPRTDPNWKDGASFALWGLDTNGDDDSDYLVSLVNAGGILTAGVIRPGEPDKVLCLGGATFDGNTYAATVDPACIGNPASIKWGGGMVYDTKPADPASPLAGDGAPDGDAMAGPLQAPAPLDRSAGGYWLVGRRRRHLQLRRRDVPRLHRRHQAQPADRRAWPPTPTARATGSWPPTAASSPSTPRSSAPPAPSR